MHQATNTFTSYILTKEEEIQGATFTNLNLAVLQNELALCAQEKLSLKFDTTDTLSFVQQEAELQGKIGILQYLIAQHHEVQTRNTNLEIGD